MSTRSRIAIENEDGSIDSIYCHSDGYPSWNGKILYEHYQNPDKTRELINLGGISSLNENIGEAHDFDDREYCEKNKCVNAYVRDRNEPLEDNKVYHSLNLIAFVASLKRFWDEDYWYIFMKGSWYYNSTSNLVKKGFKLLTDKDIDNKDL